VAKRNPVPLLVVCLAAFMLLLDLTIVNVALVDIQRALDASFDDLQWVIDAYALALAAFLLAGGALADRIGRKRVFVVGLAAFVLASLACGLASSPVVLVVGRAVQGVGGALLLASAPAVLSAAYQGDERKQAFGAFGGAAGLAIALGPLIGGVLTSADWRWIFLVNIPLGVICLILAVRGLDESRLPGAVSVDWWGTVTLCAGLSLVVFGLIRGHGEGWGSTTIVASFAVGALALVAFVVLQARGSAPLMRLNLFRNATFNGLSLATLAANAAIFPLIFLVVLYLQQVAGYSAVQTGVRLLPLTGALFVASAATVVLMGRVPARVLIGAGLVLTGVGLLLIDGLSPESSWTALLPGFVVAGIGVGLFNPVRAESAVALVAPEEAGMASGVSSTFQEVGVALGIAVFGSLFESRAGAGLTDGAPGARLSAAARDAFTQGVNDVALIAGIMTILAGFVALALIRERDLQASDTSTPVDTALSPAPSHAR
jgi:EmrB/QacA subfamily drug resistance transporter